MSSVVCVTVTYGDRRSLLLEVISGLVGIGVDEVIVVNNGSSWPVSEELGDRYSSFVKVVEMGQNMGSAAGFAAGLKAGFQTRHDFIFMLDDDNLPSSNCIEILKNKFNQEYISAPNPIALLAYRPQHQPDVAAGIPGNKINARDNSFRGFHVFDIPRKIRNRFFSRRRTLDNKPEETVQLNIAPYSGLFFRREDISRIGYPREDFVLYSDDSEFTYRFKKNGGLIILVTDAKIEDLESSWNVRKDRATSSFEIILNQGSDFRAYYGTRNAVYFGRYCRPSNSFLSWTNRTIYLSILLIFAIQLRKLPRYRLVKRAVSDGLKGNLGISSAFPLNS